MRGLNENDTKFVHTSFTIKTVWKWEFCILWDEIALHKSKLSALQRELLTHQETNKHKEFQMSDLEAAQLHKDSLIENHLFNIDELSNKLQLLQAEGRDKDATIQEHILGHRQKDRNLTASQRNFFHDCKWTYKFATHNTF